MNARAEVALDSLEDQLREFYELRLKIAQATREDLVKALGDGLPRLAVTPEGGYDGLVGLQHGRIFRLVNAHLAACAALDEAARELQDAMDWSEDEAIDNGIVWRVEL